VVKRRREIFNFIFWRNPFTFRREEGVDFISSRKILLFNDFPIPIENCNFDVLLPVFLPASGGL
jgi:hypothetical protein